MPGVGRGPIFQPKPPPPAPAPFAPGTPGAPGVQNVSADGGRLPVTPTSAGQGSSSRGTAALRVYAVVWNGPTARTFPITTLIANVTGTSWDGSNLTVEVQVATDLAFTTGVATFNATGQTSGANSLVTVTGLSLGTRYYFRARAGESGVVSDWTRPVAILITATAGDAAEYAYANVGVSLVLSRDATEYLYENVGAALPISRDASEYVYEEALAVTPSPYVFALRPTAGRGGDGVTLLGAGFGASQAEFSGVVEGYDSETEEWTTLPVVSWSRIAASGDAYTATRRIEPYTPDVDPEHDEIQVTVPSWAEPPTLQVRVRTEGP